MERIRNIIVVISMAVLLFGMSAWAWLKPADKMSDSERRQLSQFPEIKTETILKGTFMDEFESYTLDQFPLRDTFRTVKAVSTYRFFWKLDNNKIYTVNGHYSKLEYPMNEALLDNAAKKFQAIYDKFLTGLNVKFVIVPDKNYYLADKNGYLSMDYDKLIEIMKEKTSFMEYIDVRDLLTIDNYYRTDTHWKQETILPVADRIAERFGVTLDKNYTEKVLEVPFKGVYYGQSAMHPTPDTIRYLTNSILEDCKVTSYSTGKKEPGVMYNFDKGAGKDGYDFFLSGADPLIVIENKNATSDRELVVFRDSFGSSITPLLVSAYRKVTLVDIRYVQSSMIGSLVKFKNQDVLFLYSTMLLNNSAAFK